MKASMYPRCSSFFARRSRQCSTRTLCPKSFSTSSATQNKDFKSALPLFLEQSKWNLDSYGLSASLVDEQTLQTIRQLPEVEEVLVSPPLTAIEKQLAVDKMRRATDVFQEMNSGGTEHMACLAMLAETSGVAGSVEAELILDRMLSAESKLGSVVNSILRIAEAKSAYYRGDFASARAICEDILDSDTQGHPIGVVAASRTILGASRLQSMQTIDDAFSVRDPFRMVVKYIERNNPRDKLALAAAHYNLGTAEAVYAQAVSKFNNVEVPLDSALRSWKQGSTIISNMQSCRLLKARCLTNISWGLIQTAEDTGDTDYLKQASEYGQSALGCYKDTIVKDGLGRTLCSLAICAQKGGQAVTAQGLFASAMDQEKDTVAGKLNFIVTLQSYARLLDDWEKRENEAKAMRGKIETVTLPTAWADRSAISGSMWLYGLGIFK